MPTSRRIISIYADAPVKPAAGEPCNGCGVCCLAELCPLAQLRFLQRTGPCPALQWRQAEQRYVCGMLAGSRNAISRWWVARSIAAGAGCDCTIEVE